MAVSLSLPPSLSSLPFLSPPISSTLISPPSAMAGEKKLMKAVQYESYGGGAAALKHVEVPMPSAGEKKKGEIVMKVEAVSLNPFDWKLQTGMLRPFLPSKLPYIPAVDVAGEVIEVGSGVNDFKIGDKVLSMLKVGQGGGLAEFAVAPVETTVILPPELSAAEAAALPMAAVTALQALRAAGIKIDGAAAQQHPIKNVLVTAASGGVGHYAVQLAKLSGHHVTATCGARNIEFVKGLGADEVLDYKTPEGAALASPSGKNYDAVIHCTTGISWSTFEPQLSSSSTVMDLSPTFKSMLDSLVKKMTFAKKKLAVFMLSMKREDLEFLVEQAKEGKLKTAVDSRYPLSRAEEAWVKSVEGHATGKIIVDI